MKKHLYRHATTLQSALRRAAGDFPLPVNFGKLCPRVQLDAWATLFRWHQAGEPTVRITDESEDAAISAPLPRDLHLATHPLRHEAVAFQLPERSLWIVLARHAPAPCHVVVWQEHGWDFAQPLLTYCANTESGGLAAGYINLADQPTLADLRLDPGHIMRRDGKTDKLTDAEITDDDYRLTLAIHHLYCRNQ